MNQPANSPPDQESPVTYYKFLNLNTDGKIVSEHGKQEWVVGETYTVEGEIRACNSGFHASEKFEHALSFVKGQVFAIVEASGEIDTSSFKKIASRSMKIVKAYKWTAKDSVALAVAAAESVLHIFEERFPSDDRPRKAIEAARSGNAGVADADAAYAAYAADAADAAYAADAAADAAYAADADAAYAYADAAYAADAAADAAYAAYAAAGAAAYAAAAYAADAAAAAYANAAFDSNAWIVSYVQNLPVL